MAGEIVGMDKVLGEKTQRIMSYQEYKMVQERKWSIMLNTTWEVK